MIGQDSHGVCTGLAITVGRDQIVDLCIEKL